MVFIRRYNRWEYLMSENFIASQHGLGSGTGATQRRSNPPKIGTRGGWQVLKS